MADPLPADKAAAAVREPVYVWQGQEIDDQRTQITRAYESLTCFDDGTWVHSWSRSEDSVYSDDVIDDRRTWRGTWVPANADGAAGAAPDRPVLLLTAVAGETLRIREREDNEPVARTPGPGGREIRVAVGWTGLSFPLDGEFVLSLKTWPPALDEARRAAAALARRERREQTRAGMEQIYEGQTETGRRGDPRSYEKLYLEASGAARFTVTLVNITTPSGRPIHKQEAHTGTWEREGNDYIVSITAVRVTRTALDGGGSATKTKDVDGRVVLDSTAATVVFGRRGRTDLRSAFGPHGTQESDDDDDDFFPGG